jgi:regulator of replication initiation timing
MVHYKNQSGQLGATNSRLMAENARLLKEIEVLKKRISELEDEKKSKVAES